MLTIFDGNNWFRRRCETALGGSVIRNCFYEIHNTTGAVILVWDGPGGNSKRRSIYPEYKLTRNKPDDSFYESQKMFVELSKFTKAVIIQVPGYEGDDVIAKLVTGALTSGMPASEIFVHSNDADLGQLGVPMARETFKIPPDQIRMYKTLVGDSSDNIPGLKGFGEGAYKALAPADIDQLEEIILHGENIPPEQLKPRVEGLFKPKVLENFLSVETRLQLRVFHQIVGFMEVPDGLLRLHTETGSGRVDLAEEVMRKFYL